MTSAAAITGQEHWAKKGEVKLFLFEKYSGSPDGKPVVLFVHGSSMTAQATFDLQIPGRPLSSAMDYFAERGFDAWCIDMEGYGRSDKSRDINFDIDTGADDLAAASEYLLRERGVKSILLYGNSSGALRAGLFAQRHPDCVARLALDACVWTGEGSATLLERRKKLADFTARNRRPINLPFLRSVFDRDNPACVERSVVDAYAAQVLALDDSMPTGSYIDMCSRLPMIDPAKITMATIIMRGQFDGIASFDDLIGFFRRLPNPDKQFAMMPGISHNSFQQINYLTVYHILHSFFAQPAPLFRDAEDARQHSNAP